MTPTKKTATRRHEPAQTQDYASQGRHSQDPSAVGASSQRRTRRIEYLWLPCWLCTTCASVVSETALDMDLNKTSSAASDIAECQFVPLRLKHQVDTRLQWLRFLQASLKILCMLSAFCSSLPPTASCCSSSSCASASTSRAPSLGSSAGVLQVRWRMCAMPSVAGASRDSPCSHALRWMSVKAEIDEQRHDEHSNISVGATTATPQSFDMTRCATTSSLTTMHISDRRDLDNISQHEFKESPLLTGVSINAILQGGTPINSWARLVVEQDALMMAEPMWSYNARIRSTCTAMQRRQSHQQKIDAAHLDVISALLDQLRQRGGKHISVHKSLNLLACAYNDEKMQADSDHEIFALSAMPLNSASCGPSLPACFMGRLIAPVVDMLDMHEAKRSFDMVDSHRTGSMSGVHIRSNNDFTLMMPGVSHAAYSVLNSRVVRVVQAIGQASGPLFRSCKHRHQRRRVQREPVFLSGLHGCPELPED